MFKGDAAVTATAVPPPITWHGGPVMMGTVNIYYIWYGTLWSGNSATRILENLAKNIGGSAYYNIQTSYTNGTAGFPLSNSTKFVKSVNSTYLRKTRLTVSDIQSTPSACTQLCASSMHVFNLRQALHLDRPTALGWGSALLAAPVQCASPGPQVAATRGVLLRHPPAARLVAVRPGPRSGRRHRHDAVPVRPGVKYTSGVLASL